MQRRKDIGLIVFGTRISAWRTILAKGRKGGSSCDYGAFPFLDLLLETAH